MSSDIERVISNIAEDIRVLERAVRRIETVESPPVSVHLFVVNLVIGTGQAVISTGIQLSFQMPNFPYELTDWYWMSEETGTCEIDLWVDATPNPTDADSITGGDEITVTAAKNDNDVPTSNWIKTFTGLEWWTVNFDSNATFEQGTLALHFKRLATV